MTSFITALGFGLLIGAQHAFEPDHLAAVGTLLPDESSTRRAAVRGAWWGLGHGAAIASVGLPLIILGLQMPEHLEAIAEMVVAIMLIALGVNAVIRARRGPAQNQKTTPQVAKAAFPVGLLHGLAGSGGAVVLASAQSTSPGASLVFLIVFVLGSTLSMTLVAGFFAVPFGRISQRPSALPWLLGGVGALSIAVGMVWGWPHVVGWLS